VTSSGAYVRPPSAFRDRIAPDGDGRFPAAVSRYHLYVSHACPWSHRALVVRQLKGLEHAIGVTSVDPIRDEGGWRFTAEHPDFLNGWTFLSEAYQRTDPRFTGRPSVPVLWDTQTGRIVNNESAEIIELLNSAWDTVAGRPALDLYPADLRPVIDELNDWIYADVNNGVYRAGFATSQGAYEQAVTTVFAALDRLDARLGVRRYLVGDRQTLADWRLFPTLVRFDVAYVGHFKCNLRRIADYPHLSGYLRDLFQTPGISDTVDIGQIKRHFYRSQPHINPNGIVALGPVQDLWAPHGREAVGRAPGAA
jgi:putative glutathione S-transferase